MEIIEDILEFEEKIGESCVAIGVFDGIHLGHRELIEKAVKAAKSKGIKSVVFSFYNHPLELSKTKKAPKLINTIEERIYLMEKLGVDYLILQKFTRRFSEIEPEQFIKNILIKRLNAKNLFVGFNFKFGRDGKGSVEFLKERGKKIGIEVEIVEPIKIDNEIVSSTKIREFLQKGDLKKANQYLGENLLIVGTVVHGKKIGRLLGFPTANLNIMDRVYPPFGIYGGKVRVEGENEIKDAVINIGRNPTLKPDEKTIEIHILDYDREIYGKKVYLQLMEFLREEKKFKDVEELKENIAKDILNWRERLRR